MPVTAAAASSSFILSKRTVAGAPSARQLRGVRTAAIVAAVMGTVAGAAHAQTYIGVNGGNWDTASNWTGGIVPNSGTATVTNNVANATVIVPAGTTHTVSTLTIGSTSGVTVGDNDFFYLNSALTDNGLLNLTSTGNDTRLRTNGNNVSLSGSGAIVLTNAAIDGGGTVTTAAGLTIRGTGNIGVNNTLFANAGTINANVNGGTLLLDPANATAINTNTGTLTASNGGTLRMTGSGGGAWDNTGGTISAQTGSFVTFDSSNSISNGTITSSGTGLFRVGVGETAYLNKVSSTADVRVGDNAYLYLISSFANNNNITLETVTNDTRLRTDGNNLNITGTGGISLATGGSIDGGGVITFGSGQTVHGQGNIGLNNTGFVNNGTVRADISGKTLTVDPANLGATSFLNNASLVASNGGTLNITGSGGGDFTNAAAATMTATGSGSVVLLSSSARVIGGTFTGTSGGAINELDGDTVYLQNTTISSGTTYTIGNNAYTILEGGITNNGTITYKPLANANAQRLRTNNADVTITGTGKIILNNNLTSGGDAVIDGGGRITFGSGQTISGSGSIGYNNSTITNNGIIESGVGGIGLDPANLANGFVNNNIIRAISGGNVTLSGNGGGDFYNSAGQILSTGTGNITLVSSVRIIGGTVSGTINQVNGDYAYLQGLTIATGSTYNVGNNAYTVIEGGITNNGTITYKTLGNASNQRLRTNGSDITIGGTGSIVLNNNTSAAGGDTVIDGGGRITFGSGQTITGSGSIGYNNSTVTNNGIIESGVGGIGLDPANLANGFVNNNIIRAVSGGSIILSGNAGGDFINTAGQILSTGTGSITLASSARVIGGTISGKIGQTIGDYAYLQGLTLTSGSTYTVGNNSFTVVEGGITNNGTITFNTAANGNNQRLRTNGSDITISGTGSIVLNNNTSAAGGDTAIDGGARVTFGAGQTISGSGSLGYNNTSFTSNGTIVSNVGGIGIDPSNVANAFVNNGTLRATTGGNITLNGNAGGGFSGAGPILDDVSSSISVVNGAGGSIGAISGLGTLNVDTSSDMTFTSVRVDTVNVTNSAYLRFAAGGTTAGTGKTTNLTINSSGHLDVSNHGLVLTGTSATTVRGYLASGRGTNNAWNGVGINSSLAGGATHKAVGYAIASQVFSTVPATFLGQPITASSVLVRWTTDGDADLNGTTDFNDLLRLAQNYGNPGVWVQGDFDYNNTVDFNDLLLLAGAYGQTAPGSAQIAELDAINAGIGADFQLARSMVPEPTTALAMLGLASALMPIRRRR